MLVLALAACGTTSAGAGASATATARAAATSTAAARAQATATATAQPVTLAAGLAQRGTVAANDVRLTATVTIANHTAAPIHLANNICWADIADTTGGRPNHRPATIGLMVEDAPPHAIWYSWVGIPCIQGAAYVDVQEVPAGGTFTAALTCDLSRGFAAGVALRAGAPYTIRVKVFFWHQGTVDQFLQAYLHPEQPGVLWGNELAVNLPFTFQ